MIGENNMNDERYTVRAPGKLFIAGEYAITEPNQDSIVVAVDRYLSVEIQASPFNRLDLPEMQLMNMQWNEKFGKAIFKKYHPRLRFIKHILDTFYDYVDGHDPVHILVTSELDSSSGKKYGLGSSAALSVAFLTALLKFSKQYERVNDRLTIFKLASIAHFRAQGNGSCADIAASTYGGWINYRTFDSTWLVGQLNQGRSVKSLVETNWPGLKIVPLKQPDPLHFLIGWTKATARTAPMVAKVHRLKVNQPNHYRYFLKVSQMAVEQMISGFQAGKSDKVIAGMKANRSALRALGIEANVPIETPKLTNLIEAALPFGAAKTSGAGGGDCGIAFIKQADEIEQVYRLWCEVGIEPLKLNVSAVGVKIN